MLPDISHHVTALEALCQNAEDGLPDEVFAFISRLTPLVNVDLLIRRPTRTHGSAVLLTWRHDEFYTGWHVPGGILRFKEAWIARLNAVANLELGSSVAGNPSLVGVFEMMAPERSTRGHFNSLLYACDLTTPPDPNRACRELSTPRHGEWAWFPSVPANFLPQQSAYISILERTLREQ